MVSLIKAPETIATGKRTGDRIRMARTLAHSRAWKSGTVGIDSEYRWKCGDCGRRHKRCDLLFNHIVHCN